MPETPGIGERPAPWRKTRVVGKTLPRIDAYERVSGAALYPSDVAPSNMLHGAILRCPHPHARVIRVDTARARRMPGVHAVIDGSTPGADLDWTYAGTGTTFQTKIFDTVCRFEGEAVAAVAAKNPYQTSDALRAIDVTYDVLPFTSDERTALAPSSPPVHSGGNQVGKTDTYSRGDADLGFAEADVVLEEHYRTACEIHTPLERHGCVAEWKGDRLTLWESTQGVYAVQKTIADILGMPLSKVRVIGHYMGGGFGSKLQPGKYTVIAALLARVTGCPVRIFLSREETFLAAGNRPPTNMRLKAGVKKDGTLTAFDFTCTGSGGAYPAGGALVVDWLIRDLYACPNVRTTADDVYINAGPARAFRAPGHPQGAWALEQMMDALAAAIGMDPVAFRLINIPNVSQARKGHPPYGTPGFAECLRRGAEVFGWNEARKQSGGTGPIRRGVGMAGGLWSSGDGRPPSTIILKLYADGSVNLNMGASDIGTGTKTVMAMVAAEELGIRPQAVQIEHADTGTTQFATPSGGSKTVPTEAPAVRAAAVSVKQQLLEMAARNLKTEPADLRYTPGVVVSRSDPSKRIAVDRISGLRMAGVVVGVGYRDPNPPNRVINPFAAHFCEVAVDMRTGEVRILRFLAAHDSGRVMNRLTYDNQVFGGITMGIGLAMTESRLLDGNQTGKMVNGNWHDYKIPTALDIPADMVSLPIEIPDDEANTTGAKGLGEPVTIPTAPAVANAIYNATGLRVAETPIDPLRLCGLLAAQRKEA